MRTKEEVISSNENLLNFLLEATQNIKESPYVVYGPEDNGYVLGWLSCRETMMQAFSLWKDGK